MTKLLRPLALLALIALAACAYIAPIQPRAVYYVMRHLDTPQGVQDPGLTEQGRQRAERLAEFFGDNPPASILVSDTRRARETAAPLAARLGIEPRVYDATDTAGLIAEISKEPPPVLIVGHSNTVPEIIERLGGERPAPLAHEDFGDIWRIEQGRRETLRRRID